MSTLPCCNRTSNSEPLISDSAASLLTSSCASRVYASVPVLCCPCADRSPQRKKAHTHTHTHLKKKMENTDEYSTSTEQKEALDVGGALIFPLCMAVNQTFTRVAVGHEEGFLVFTMSPECGEVHDDLAHLFSSTETSKRSAVRAGKPALRSARVDPLYSLRPEVARALRQPHHPPSPANATTRTSETGSDATAATVKTEKKVSRTDAPSAHSQESVLGVEDADAPPVTAHDLLTLSRRSLARRQRVLETLRVARDATVDRHSDSEKGSAGRVDRDAVVRATARQVSAPPAEDDDEGEARQAGAAAMKTRSWVAVARLHKRRSGAEDDAAPSVQTTAPASRAFAGTDTKAPLPEDAPLSCASIPRVEAGGVAVIAMLYNYPQLAVVGGGPTPMGPPDEVLMLRHGELINRIRIPTEQKTEEVVPGNPEQVGASASYTGTVDEAAATAITPDRCIVQLALDTRVLFVCTMQRLYIFTDPDSRSTTTCQFSFPFYASAPPSSPLWCGQVTRDNAHAAATLTPASLDLARALAKARACTMDTGEKEERSQSDAEVAVNTLCRYAAQPLPARPLQVDYAHGLFLIGCSAEVLRSGTFARLCRSSALASTIDVNGDEERGDDGDRDGVVPTPHRLHAQSGKDIINSVCLFSYHSSWAAPPQSAHARGSKLDIRVQAARAHVTKAPLDHVAMYVGPLTSFSAASVERACRAAADRRNSGHPLIHTPEAPRPPSIVSWRPAQDKRRTMQDWRTLGRGGSKQHLQPDEAILVVTAGRRGTRLRLWCVTSITTEDASTAVRAATYCVLPFRDLRVGVGMPDWLRASPLFSSPPSVPPSPPSVPAGSTTSPPPPPPEDSQRRTGASGRGGGWRTGWASAAAGGLRSWVQSAVEATMEATVEAGASLGTSWRGKDKTTSRATSAPSTVPQTMGTTGPPMSVAWQPIEAIRAHDNEDARQRIHHLQFLDTAHFLLCVREDTIQVFAVGEAQNDLSEFKQEWLVGASATVPLSAHELKLTTNKHTTASKLWSGLKGLLPPSAQVYSAQQWAACTARLFPSTLTEGDVLSTEQRSLARRARARWLPVWLAARPQEELSAARIIASAADARANGRGVDVAAEATVTFPLVWGRAPCHLAACLVMWEQDCAVPYAQQAAVRTHIADNARHRDRHRRVRGAAGGDGDSQCDPAVTEDEDDADEDVSWPANPSATPSPLWMEKANGPRIPTTSAPLDDAQRRKSPWLGGGVATKVVLTMVNCEGRALTARLYADTAEMFLSTTVDPTE